MVAWSLAAWRAEMADPDFKRGIAGEFVNSYLLLFTTLGMVVFSQDGGISVERGMALAVLTGAVVTILIYIFAGISGAHFNCAFSWAAYLLGRLSPCRLVCYTLTQICGMTLGTATIYWMTPVLFMKVDGGANFVHYEIATQGLAIFVEVATTFMVFITCIATMDEARVRDNPHLRTVGPIVIGMAVTLAIFVGVPITNCSLNPSRSLAVSIVSGVGWEDMHVVRACVRACVRASGLIMHNWRVE